MAWQLCTYFKNVPFKCSHKIKAKLQKSQLELASWPNGEHVSHSSCICYYSVLCTPSLPSSPPSQFKRLLWSTGIPSRTHTHTHTRTDRHILCATRLLTCQLKRLTILFALAYFIQRHFPESSRASSEFTSSPAKPTTNTWSRFLICFRAVICGYLRALC